MNARILLLAALGGLLTSWPARAQPPDPGPLVRADVHGVAGWSNVHEGATNQWDRWDHGLAHAAAGLGWYWSDHLKTEVTAEVTSTATFYRFEFVGSPLAGVGRSSTVQVRGSSVGVLQHYQFLRNAWVHPFVGAGVELRRERRVDLLDPLVTYDAPSGVPRVVEPSRRIDRPAAWQARGVIVGGVKAYVSPRVFTRCDAKVALRDGVDEVALRAGIGVDF